MVDVVSRIKLLFTAQGADKAAKQTEKIGYLQHKVERRRPSKLKKLVVLKHV